MPQMTDVHSLAAEASGFFETAQDHENKPYVRLKETAPQWLQETVRYAHGDMLPDDWRYRWIRDAFDAIHDAGPDADLEEVGIEFADDADIYNSDLIDWLGSHGSRMGYCDEAFETFEGDISSIATLMQLGQCQERAEIFASVVASLVSQD